MLFALVGVMIGYPLFDLAGRMKSEHRTAQQAHPQCAAERIIAILAIVEQRQAEALSAAYPAQVNPVLTRLLTTVIDTPDMPVGD